MEELLQKVNLTKLELISKSKNGPGKPIYREDLPSVLFNRAPRVILGSAWFNKYSKDSQNKKVCESCGKISSLERHELYGLYKYGNQPVVKLEGILCLCKTCHQQIHGGFSSRLNMKYGFMNNPVPVSDAFNTKKFPWNQAKFIVIEEGLYRL